MKSAGLLTDTASKSFPKPTISLDLIHTGGFKICFDRKRNFLFNYKTASIYKNEHIFKYALKYFLTFLHYFRKKHPISD